MGCSAAEAMLLDELGGNVLETAYLRRGIHGPGELAACFPTGKRSKFWIC